MRGGGAPVRKRTKGTGWHRAGAIGLAAAAVLVAAAPGGAIDAAIDRPAPIADADFRPTDPALAELGRLLFYDPILSGNRNISCGTCHNHDHASADGLSLPVGEGGRGLGPKRDVGEGASRIARRVPRHSPALFNLGHRSVDVLFHDGRLSVDEREPSGFDSPVTDARQHDLPADLDGIVAAQAMLPVMAGTEMAGHPTENDVARDGADELPFHWDRIADRLAAIPAYAERFEAAFSDVSGSSDIRYAHAANALSDFIESEWRSTDAPFDRWLAGEDALTPEQERGAALFYGRANCAACHSGPLLTDHGFHSIGMVQIGPGRTRVFAEGAFDRGRVNATDDPADRFLFRTPSLRNVAATAPYGHAGAYSKLESVVRHHLDPAGALERYDREEAILPRHDSLSATDFLTHENERERARIARSATIEPVALSDGEVADLVAFLGALSDPVALKGRRGKPKAVPSGLPVD